MEKFQKYLPIATFVLVLFIFLKGCGTGTQVKSTENKVETLTVKVDSLTKIVVTQDEMINVLENTTMWQTLITAGQYIWSNSLLHFTCKK